MKTIYEKIIILSIIVISIILANPFKGNLKTYTNTVPYFSFTYPNSWQEPRIYNNESKSEFQVDFGNYGFSINNGYYFSSINGKKPTVKQLIDYYQKDKDSKNEIKDFFVEQIKIDNHSAIKVTSTLLNNSNEHHTDVYIYKNNIDEDSFILITASSNFVKDVILEKIISSFKLK